MKNYKSIRNRASSDVCPECKEDPCVCNHVHEESALGDQAHQTTLKHRFLVTYSDPNHTMVSKRKEQQQKHVLVPSTKDGQTVYKGEAEPLVKKHMKNQGFKVHSIEHVGMVSKKVNEGKMGEKAAGDLDYHAEPTSWVRTGKTATHTSGEKTFEYAKVDKDGNRTGERHYRNASGKVMGEEVEQVNELNKDTLLSYMRKVSADSQKHKMDPSKRPAAKASKSVGGFAKALNKHTSTPIAKEEVEQVDELNVMTLSKYAAKARSQSMDKDNPKRYKRGSGAAKAYDKISRGDYSESVDLDEAVTVDKKNYSWGKMVTVHHGANTSYPLHPEHQAAIKKLRPGMKTTFKDETGRQIHAHREGDQVHLVHHNTGSSTATKTTVGYHHFDESVAEDYGDGQLLGGQVKEVGTMAKGSFVEIKPKAKALKKTKDVSEGTVEDKINKVGKIYNAHRIMADAARKQYPKDTEAEAKHMKGSSKAFALMQKLRTHKAAAEKSGMKPKPAQGHSDYGSSIAQDYKDQEAKRGIGHVRD